LLAVWKRDSLISLFPTKISNMKIPRVVDLPVDLRVIGFALGISILTGLVFGIVPALQTTTPDLQSALREGGRGASGGYRSRRFRSLLVIFEVALALVLMVGAGLMIKSFMRLRESDLGFNPDKVLTMRILLPPYKYKEDAQ